MLSHGSGAVSDVGIVHTRLGGASRGLRTKHGLPPPLAPSWHQGTPRWVACGVPVSCGGGECHLIYLLHAYSFLGPEIVVSSMGEAVVFGGIGHKGEVCDCALGPQETAKSTGVEVRGHSHCQIR